jgi:hypothetical protein
MERVDVEGRDHGFAVEGAIGGMLDPTARSPMIIGDRPPGHPRVSLAEAAPTW